jgi:two-component sensor histidine kinase
MSCAVRRVAETTRQSPPFAPEIFHSSHQPCEDALGLPTLVGMEHPAPHSPHKPFNGEYDGAPNVPASVVLRQWWSLNPQRPGTALQYYIATAFYNTIIAIVLTVFFAMGNRKMALWDSFVETFVISQCIGYSIHISFEVFHRLTSVSWRRSLPRSVHLGMHLLIPVWGVFVGYSIAFALNGRNFYELLVNYPRVGGMIFLVGLLVSFISYLVMDGQTQKLKNEAEEALAREAAAALQKQASDAELRALQAQIEPHFLFNTLANVQALIDYEPGKAKQMLESFIEYLRATLDATRRTQASLGDEFTMLERYLQLMQVRMGARLKTAWEIDPELRSHPFTPLLLQPLVENAIKYGLEPKIEGGTITLRARREGARIVLEVQDDGIGLGGASTARKPAKGGSGTGLVNVRARLQSTFGESATLSIANNTQGCCATLAFDAHDLSHPTPVSP